MVGTYMSYHTAEIPFVFHNVDRMLEPDDWQEARKHIVLEDA